MRHFLLGIIAVLFATQSFAAILVQSPDGSFTTKLTLEDARVSTSAVNKTIVVTSALTQAQSNITAAWPADRGLEIRFGGSLLNSTAFTFTDGRVFSAWPGYVFKGAGAITGLSGTVRAAWFGVDKTGLTDSTVMINNTITASYGVIPSLTAVSKGIISFENGTYLVGALNPITRPITIDFDRAILLPNTTGTMFTITTDPDVYPVGQDDRVIIKNATVYGRNTTPNNIIKYNYYARNPILENFHVRAVTTTGAMIFHTRGSGLHVKDSTFTDSTCPSVFTFLHSDTDNTVAFSNAIDLDHTAISNIIGQGIYFQGGDITIRGKSSIETCSVGGFFHDAAVATANNVSVNDSYFELNTGGDLNLGHSGVQTYPGTYSVKSSWFDGTVEHKIILGSKANVTVEDTRFKIGGVWGDVAPLSYVGINNTVNTNGAGFTGTYDAELDDTLKSLFTPTIINKYGVYTGRVHSKEIKLTDVPGNTTKTVTITLPSAGAPRYADLTFAFFGLAGKNAIMKFSIAGNFAEGAYFSMTTPVTVTTADIIIGSLDKSVNGKITFTVQSDITDSISIMASYTGDVELAITGAQ